MAINFVVDYTFSPNTTISSSQVNTNFSTNAAVWQGLEGLTKSFSNLRVDTAPTTTTDVVIKSYADRLNSYRRPVLQHSSVTVTNLETGINGTSGQAQILFPDGTLRTDSTASRINFDITRNAVLSGSAQSGLRTGLSEATNTWYALYAVKVSDSSTNFVVVGDTVLPLQANYATLNSNFGTSSWVYLGMIRNGDNSGATGNILAFTQAGNRTLFRNVATGNILNGQGIRVATSGSNVASLVYTYSAGTGTTDIPNHILLVYFFGAFGTSGGAATVTYSDATGTIFYGVYSNASGSAAQIFAEASTGFGEVLSGGTNEADIYMTGWIDGVLGIGANPIL